LKGDENKQPQGFTYGISIPNQKRELDEHLLMLEEAKKRDHRNLEELGIFLQMDDDAGPALWMPNGTILEELENWPKKLVKMRRIT
jgi:threonyl-tRNA synthetase